MVSKWADYAITAVEFNSYRSHIIVVEVREDLGDTLGISVQKTRQNIVELMRNRKTFVTATNASDTWKRGEAVGIIKVGDVEYLRIDNNAIEADNLGKMPELFPS